MAKTASKHLRRPVTVEVDADLQALPTVDHLVYTIQEQDKIQALQTLLDQRGNTPVIVFGRTKHGVKRLAKQLVALGYPVGALQGNLSQNARERVMTDFRSGACPILVATNVAARGLDIEGIGRVINYDLPDSELLFTHRVGPHRPHGPHRRGRHLHHHRRREQVARDRAGAGAQVHPPAVERRAGAVRGAGRRGGGRPCTMMLLRLTWAVSAFRTVRQSRPIVGKKTSPGIVLTPRHCGYDWWRADSFIGEKTGLSSFSGVDDQGSRPKRQLPRVGKAQWPPQRKTANEKPPDRQRIQATAASSKPQ